MKKIIFIALLICTGSVTAQTNQNQVINAAGEDRRLGNSNIIITDNIGEPFTQAVSKGNFLVTEGFLQPDVISPGGFTTSLVSQNLLCMDKEADGFISVSLNSSIKNYSVSYVWSPTKVCPTSDCARVDSLDAGFYSVNIIVYYRNNLGRLYRDTVRQNVTILNATEPCKVKIFNGVTPNKDGENDVLQIENIAEFPKNNITIFNRWGLEVYNTSGYNNKDKSWPAADQLDKLPASTYFYILNLGDGSKQIKGWVELIKQ